MGASLRIGMYRCLGCMAWIATLSALPALAQMDLNKLMAGITDASPDVRAEAWKAAGPVGAKAIAPLGPYISSQDHGIAKAAQAALVNITHHAGRPGAESERKAVATELAKLLDASYPAHTRREVLYCLSLVATDAEIPLIAACLADEAVADDARMALDRIPGEAAANALVEALRTAPPALQARIADSLGHKGATSAISALTALARSSDPPNEVSWACLEALARLGVPPHKVFPRKPTFTREEDARYVAGLVRAADACAASGDKKQAEGLYETAAASRTRGHQACVALTGLAELASEKAIAAALGYLAEPDVRAVALEVLEGASIAGIEDKLAKAYKQMEPYARADILRVLAVRKSPELPSLLEIAKQDESPEVRMAASEAAGAAPHDDDVTAALADASPWGRQYAAESYLKRVEAAARAGDNETVQRLCEAVVKADVANALKIEAFRAIEAAPGPKSVLLMTQLMRGLFEPGIESVVTPEAAALRERLGDDAKLALAAGRAYVAAAAAAEDREWSKVLLRMVAENADLPEVASFAVEKLRPLGGDTQAIAQRRGFVTQWKLLGPFPNPDGKAFGQSFFNEEAGILPDTLEWEGKSYRRQDVSTDNIPAIINLRDHYAQREHVAAYGYAELSVPAETPAVLLIGSDDGCEVWLNGKKVHAVGAPRALRVDGDRIEVVLQSGTNRVLIKSLQGVSHWGFCVRITDRDGKPLPPAK